MLVVRIVLIVLVIVALGVLSISFFKSAMGKAVKGTLRVPQGKDSLEVCVCEDAHLRPFKYGQTFETVFVPGETSMTSSYTGKVEHGIATITYKDKPIGLICESNTHSLVLLRLAQMHPKVVVQAMVLSIDSEGKPLIRIMIPNDKWFKRALSPKYLPS